MIYVLANIVFVKNEHMFGLIREPRLLLDFSSMLLGQLSFTGKGGDEEARRCTLLLALMSSSKVGGVC